MQSIEEAQIGASLGHSSVVSQFGPCGPEVGSPAFHNSLGLMRPWGLRMTPPGIPGTVFRVAEFQGSNWQGVNLDEFELVCSDHMVRKRGSGKEQAGAIPICNRLTDAGLGAAGIEGGNSSTADFAWAGLGRTGFTEVEIDEAAMKAQREGLAVCLPCGGIDPM